MTIHRSIAAVAVTLALSGAGAAVAGAQQASRNARLSAIGDLNAAQLVEVRDRAGQVLLHGTFKTSENEPKEIEREADLASPSGQASKGKVEIELSLKDGVVTESQFEIEVEKLPALTECEVFVDGRLVASLNTSKKGKAEVEFKWKTASAR